MCRKLITRLGLIAASASGLATALVSGCGGSASSTSPTSFSPEVVQESVIDTCQKGVRNTLKDPDSARFSDWKAWEVTNPSSKPMGTLTYTPGAGDRFYSSGGMVNAKNSFGGYNGNEPFICDAIVSREGHIRAHVEKMPIPGADS